MADHPETTAPALTMLPPWSWAIVHAGKRLENRDWKRGCSYRGPVWLHTSNAPAGDDEKVLRSAARRQDGTRRGSKAAGVYIDDVQGMLDAIVFTGVDTGPITHRALLATRGMILGRATIVGTVERREDDKGAFGLGTWDDSPSGLYRRALKPAEAAWWTGGLALLLDNVVALAEPVPCKGALGFWTVPEDVEAKCLAQIVRRS